MHLQMSSRKKEQKKGELKAVIKDEAKEQRVKTKRRKAGGAWKGDWTASAGKGPVRVFCEKRVRRFSTERRSLELIEWVWIEMVWKNQLPVTT